MSRVVFMGTPDFALPTLESLCKHHQVVAVYTKPPKPQGRGYKLQKTPIHLYAEKHDIPVFTPSTLRNQEVVDELKAWNPDWIVVAAYGLILPKSVLEIPKHLCLNVHASILPKYRGAAPIAYSILYGEKETGITIMKMEEGLDTGPMILIKKHIMKGDETTGSLTEILGKMGEDAIIEAIEGLEQGRLKMIPQDDSLSTHAPKISKEQMYIDFNKSPQEIDQMVRALNPWPYARCVIGDEEVKVLKVSIREDSDSKTWGKIIDGELNIEVKGGIIKIEELCPLSGKAMSGKAFLLGRPHLVGSIIKSN